VARAVTTNMTTDEVPVMCSFAPSQHKSTLRVDRDLYEPSPSAGWPTVYRVMGVSPEAWRGSVV